ncbi:hypothetical protein KCU99_g283, partial [Aureobasidium melanogenum]
MHYPKVAPPKILSAGETTISGLSGAEQGLASGFSLRGVVVLAALLEGQRSKKFANPLCLHVPALEALVEQSDTQSDIDTHPLLIDLSSDTVLNEDVGTVGSNLVATITNLGDDLAVPLSLCLAAGHEATHDDIIDSTPVLRGTCGYMGDDVGFRVFLVETRLVTDRALLDLHDMLLALLFIRKIIVRQSTTFLSVG